MIPGKKEISMAKYSRLKVITTMLETGAVPIFYHADPDIAEKVIDIRRMKKIKLLKLN